MIGAINQMLIFGPVFTMLLLTMLVWFYMFARRIPFIRANKIADDKLNPSDLRQLAPAAVSNPADNLRNLFEIPPLFYFLCLYLYITFQVDLVYLGAAWIFVIFRILHSLVHCTANIVIVRFAFYAVSTGAFWFMLIISGLDFLQAT